MKRSLAQSTLATGAILVLCCVSLLSHSAPLVAEPIKNPSVKAGVPFFYYHNLEEAAAWYEHKLGLKKHADEGWVIIFELNPSSHIGLVNASDGSLRPTEEKGALLSIETDDLEAWYKKLQSVEGINMIHGIEVGGQGLIEEFRMRDPGGYVVEFFRWRIDPQRFMQRER